MDSITAQSLNRLCTHLRNLCKASEVLGCSKQRKQTRSADVTLANLPAGLFVQFRGADGSELDIPLHGMEEVPETIRMACVGLDSRDYALSGTSAAASRARDNTEQAGEVRKLSASLNKSAGELAAAQREAKALQKDLEAVNLQLTQRDAKIFAYESDPPFVALGMESARADKAEAECAKLRARVDQLMLGEASTVPADAQAEAARVRALIERCERMEAEAQSAARENAALQRTVDKLRTPGAPRALLQAASEGQALSNPIAITVPAAGGILDVLRQRSDVTVSADGRRVEFHKAQGYGVGDRLKAEGFKYSTAEHKEGRKVWTR